MKRFLFAASALALAVAVTAAQDPTIPAQGRVKAVQPEPKANPFGAQPGGFTTTARITPARMATLEEEFETIEAHREVRKAHVKAVEVAVKAAETQLELVSKTNAPQLELMKAKLEVEAARAQLDIKIAEMKEVEVKVKYAKKRLDEAKAIGVRAPVNPFPKGDVKQVDPPPQQ